jgi:hypothetical protein
VSDGAVYLQDGTVKGFASKVAPVPHWPGAIASRGDGLAGTILKQEISQRLPTFDAAVEGVEAILPDILWEYSSLRSAELIIAGWSEKRQAPEAYTIHTAINDDDIPAGMTREQADAAKASGALAKPLVLKRLSNATAGPALTLDIMIASGFDNFDIDADPTKLIADLRLVLECQRHMPLEHVKEGEGRYYVGGFAQVTTVSPEGITQRILDRWPEDKLGEKIDPGAPDWPALRAKILGAPKVSRLRRHMAEKKERKRAAF